MSEKLTLAKSFVAPELIVIVQIDLSREEVRRFPECQGISRVSKFLQLQSDFRPHSVFGILSLLCMCNRP